MKSLVQHLQDAIAAGRPLLAVRIAEDHRVSSAATAAGLETASWNCIDGFQPAAALEAKTAAAMLAVLHEAPPAPIVVACDLGSALTDVAVQRALHRLYHHWLGTARLLVIVLRPSDALPRDLDAVLPCIDAPPADSCELRRFIDATLPTIAALTPDQRDRVELACRGLRLNDVRHLLQAANNDPDGMLTGVFREKARLANRMGALQFVDVNPQDTNVGGLAALQDWIDKRSPLFSDAQAAAGAPIPKGILIMGVSGCGKSLCAKTVAQRWQAPLFRLDLNLVFSGSFGSPEAAFHNALQTIESVAPAILWIDEIENGFGLTGTNNAASDAQLFSAFLTWMQEKPPLVFVAATANRIEALPAEMIRKGRFDQVFFCDLPDETDRKAIIRIHLDRHQINPDPIDVNYVAIATEDWSGAEIEQAVIAAKIDALQQNRPTTTDDVTRHTREMIPLSETMREQIKALRSWAWNRATPASGKRR